MRGNFNGTNKRPTLKQRLQQRKDYNRRLALQDAKNRCANPRCKASLVKLAQTFCIAGDPTNRRFCSALCVDIAEEPTQEPLIPGARAGAR